MDRQQLPDPSWLPFNGKTPYWLRVVLLLFERGALFQIVGMGVMVVVVMAFLGFIRNPQMEALIDAIKETSDQHQSIARGLEEAITFLKSNQKDIRGNRMTNVDIANGVRTLCWVNALATKSTKDDDLCAELQHSANGGNTSGW